jgi:hypothetical protein
MIYLANSLINTGITLKVKEELDDMEIPYYFLNKDIQFEGRTININAFEQLKKRNPTNPYVIELKKHILNESIEGIKNSKCVLICNSSDEVLQDQTIFEASVTLLLEKPLFSYNEISLVNRELLSALNNIPVYTDLKNLKKLKPITEKEIQEISKEVTRFTKSLGKRQKLTPTEE